MTSLAGSLTERPTPLQAAYARTAKLPELPVFCLNLDRRPDRRIRARAQFRSQNLTVQQIHAPGATHIEEKRSWMLKGYCACAAAHKLAFRAAPKAGAPAVIIFEDDVILCPDFRQRFAALELSDDWGIFFFGCVFEPPGPELLTDGLQRLIGGTCDNHAYAVRAELWSELSRIYRRLSARKGDWRLDVAASSDRIVSGMQRKYATYSVWPPMAWQSRGLSNNMNGVNGNSDAQGQQMVFPEAISHLPRVVEEKERRRDGETERVKERSAIKRWGTEAKRSWPKAKAPGELTIETAEVARAGMPHRQG